jgi:hypothetical protein
MNEVLRSLHALNRGANIARRPNQVTWRREVAHGFLFSFLAIVAAIIGSASELGAATFNIANGDVTGLKNAINASSTSGEEDVINLAANGTYILTTIANVSAGSTGLPLISNLTINGNGATIMRSSDAGTPNFRILHVLGSARLDKLTLSNGHATEDDSIDGLVARSWSKAVWNCRTAR